MRYRDNPPRHGEEDRWHGGGGGLRMGAASRSFARRTAPSTSLRLVPLPVPGRI